MRLGPVEVGVGHLVRAGHQRLEVHLGLGNAGDRQRALRGAVVGHRAADDLVLHGLAGDLEELLGQFPRRLNCLAATGGEEHAIEVAGGVVGQSLSEFDRGGVRVRPEGEERKLGHLLGRGLGEFDAPVPDLHRKQPGESVDVTLAPVVVHVAAIAAHDDGHV